MSCPCDNRIMRSRLRSWWIPTLVGILLVLLPVLAILQLRWIDALGEGEARRLANAIATGTNQVAMDSQRELTELASLLRGTGEISADFGSELARRWDQWRSSTAHPELVSRILWVDPRSPTTPWIVDPQTGSITAEEWSRGQSEWQRAVTLILSDRSSDESPVVVPHDPPGMLIPLLSPDPVIGPYAAVVLLDREQMKTCFFPTLVAHHLGQDLDGALDVQVLLGGDIVYDSNGNLGQELLPADAVIRLGGTQERLERSSGGDRRVVSSQGGEDHAVSILETEQRVHDTDMASDTRFRRVVVSPVWEFRARHTAGSVAAAVAPVRRRNLAMGLGILGLLALTTGLLLVAEQRSRRVARQQMDFVAGVTHELRTPLTVIQSAAENLIDGVVEGPERSRHYGQLIYDEGRRLGDLIEGALTLAGANRAATRVKVQPVELAEFLPTALQRYWTRNNRSGSPPHPEMSAQVAPVLADPGALEQVLSNLLGNALKYGGDPPEVGVRVSSPDALHVDITVWDRGPGIPSSEQSQLFEPFFRGRAAREAQLPGSGLGLSVVKQVADELGGSVRMTSSPGGETAFSLRLPVIST